MDAAVRAPSGGNNQNWHFVTVTDPEVRAKLAPLYREAYEELQQTIYKGMRDKAKVENQKQTLRVMRSSDWLAEHFEQVPLWVMVFHRNDPTGASIYPAVWNLMLAARGEGVGTCLTTILGLLRPHQAFEILGVPHDKGWQMAAAVSCGYPLGKWGIAERRPVEQNVSHNVWGAPVAWSSDGAAPAAQ